VQIGEALQAVRPALRPRDGIAHGVWAEARVNATGATG
jgi:hypothetical protein